MTATIDRPSRLLWVGAIVCAIVLHTAGFAYVLSTAHSTESDDELGAPAMAIGIELASPKDEDSNLPMGSKAEDSTTSAASVSQKAQPKATDLPKETPDERDDPSREVSAKPKKVTKDETERQIESKTEKSTESVASEAAAPPKVERARVAEASVAPSLGSGEDLQRIKATWQKLLAAHINRFKRYPRESKRQAAAEVQLTFTLDRLGHVVQATVERSSGDTAFDEAAIAMMKRADPLPAPPPAVADENLTFSMPVNFGHRH